MQISQLLDPHEIIPNMVCIVGSIASQSQDTCKAVYKVYIQSLSATTLRYHLLLD